MDSSTLEWSCAIPRGDSSSADEIEPSVPNKMDQMVDLESGTIHELNKPGMWQYPTNADLCCIYRVPNCLRSVNPEAYTPQLVLIGPLHRSLKSQALKSPGDITNAKFMGYSNTEARKKIYLAEFARRVDGRKNIDDLRRMIKEDEERIRASYSESTTWIQSPDFVEMILLDSIFIFHVLKAFPTRREKIGDPLMDEPCLAITVRRDLMLLENQLPYFILKKLAEPIVFPPQGFRESIIRYFGFQGKIRDGSKFSHFTDLFRCVSVETLPNQITDPVMAIPLSYELNVKPIEIQTFDRIGHMYNTDKLNTGGVEFSLNKEAVGKELSLYVRFDNGCLEMPCLKVDDELEMKLRNIMALEQCHYPSKAHVCNYVIFLDYLIDTDKDVDLLVEKGIIQNRIGQHGSVAEMVNKLCLGIGEVGSYYSDIAADVIDYYTNPFNRSRAILKSVYFSNLWTGTATVAAVLLLLMTLIQTVASIIQVMQNAP